MSLKFISEQISDFLCSSESEVMAIQGEWGIGKTFTWNKLLNENKNSLRFDRYSYVSLFGLSSLDGLKYSIFENTIPIDVIGQEPTLENATENTASILEVITRKATKIAKEVPVIKNFSSTLESISFMSVRNMIVVIDDLERRGKNLEVKDVLGLVSLLKEQKGCKVVLLLNNGTTGMGEYVTYKEKVIDRDVTYNPTAEECANIAYAEENKYFSILRKHSIALGIKNIRILKKIERFVSKLVDVVEHDINVFPDNTGVIVNELIHSITLYCWSHYAFSAEGEIPSLDYIATVKNIYLSDDKDDQKKSWKNTLLKYNYRLTSDLDSILIDMVQLGYIDSSGFEKQIILKNEEIDRSKKRDSLFEAWKFFRCSFDNNQDEVVEKLYTAIVNGIDHVSPDNLDEVVSLLREFDEDVKANELIGLFISRRNDVLVEYIQSGHRRLRGINDAELSKKIDEVSLEINSTGSIEDILEKLSQQNGWSDVDEELLDKATEEDFYNLFKKVVYEDGGSIIATALKFGDYSNGSDRMKRIGDKARCVLMKIGDESFINSRRVKRYI